MQKPDSAELPFPEAQIAGMRCCTNPDRQVTTEVGCLNCGVSITATKNVGQAKDAINEATFLAALRCYNNNQIAPETRISDALAVLNRGSAKRDAPKTRKRWELFPAIATIVALVLVFVVGPMDTATCTHGSNNAGIIGGIGIAFCVLVAEMWAVNAIINAVKGE